MGYFAPNCFRFQELMTRRHGYLILVTALFVALFQSGCVAPGNLGLSPTNLNFGSVSIGSSSSQIVTITNSGTAAFTITRAAVSGKGFDIKAPALPMTLAVGQSAKITTSFTPAAIGNTSGSVLITRTQLDSPRENSAIVQTAAIVTTQQATIALTGAGVSVAPSITTQPISQTAVAGQTATFLVAASGETPLTYQWRKNGTSINGATSTTYTTPAAATSDSGSQFSVVVSNSAGNVSSNVASFTVTGTGMAPSIILQPSSQTVIVGKKATFSVTGSGAAPLSYQWWENGTAISGATSTTYTTPPTATSDSGSQFTVVVSNSAGDATSNAAALSVTASAVAPSITTQPASQSVSTSQKATFLVAASGTAPLSYQWRKNGTAISGATLSSYTTPVTTTADAGSQFTVAVTNSAGTVTSNTATLTVNAAGQLTASTANLNYGNVTVGSSNMLPVRLTNTGGLSVSISNVTLSGAGLSIGGVSSGLILAAGSSATLNVTYAPSGSGILNGSVIVTSNATNLMVTISLSGTAVQPVSHSATLNLTPNSSTVTGYNIYRSSISNGPFTKLNSPLVNSTAYVDSSVLANQTYYYVATSVDSAGNETAYSNQVSATIPTP
jgi:hypothetical protein